LRTFTRLKKFLIKFFKKFSNFFFKDPTLIILIVAGFVSLLLSFVEPGQGGGVVAVNGGNNNNTNNFGGNMTTTTTTGLEGLLNETETNNNVARRERNWNASAKPLPVTLSSKKRDFMIFCSHKSARFIWRT